MTGVVTGALAAVGDTVELETLNYAGAVVSWSGTFTGVGLAFEALYDPMGTSWIAVAGAPVAGGSAVTTLSSLSTVNAYEVYAPGASAVRVRCTALTTGPMNVRAVPISVMQDPSPGVSGSVNLATISSSSNALIGDVSNTPRATSGGLTAPHKLASAAATTNATSVKTTAGRLYKIRGYNANAAVRYLKIYNKASAPTVGTDVPVFTLALKPADVFDLDLAPIGEYFSTGIAYAITTGVADADTGALTAGDIVGLAMWYA